MKGSKVIKMDDIDLLGSSTYQYDGKEFGKGKWYGLSKDYNNIGCLTYNKEMFKAAGIAPLSETVPITYYDELYDLGKKLTKKDSAGKVQRVGLRVPLHGAWTNFLVSDMATAQDLSIYADATRSVDEQRPEDARHLEVLGPLHGGGHLPQRAEPEHRLGGRELPVRPGRPSSSSATGSARSCAPTRAIDDEVRLGPDARSSRRAARA